MRLSGPPYLWRHQRGPRAAPVLAHALPPALAALPPPGTQVSMARARPPASGKPCNTPSSLALFGVRRVLRAASLPPPLQTTARLRLLACKFPRPEPSASCAGRRDGITVHPRAPRDLAAAASTRIGRGAEANRLGSLHRIRPQRGRVLNHPVPARPPPHRTYAHTAFI